MIWLSLFGLPGFSLVDIAFSVARWSILLGIPEQGADVDLYSPSLQAIPGGINVI